MNLSDKFDALVDMLEAAIPEPDALDVSRIMFLRGMGKEIRDIKAYGQRTEEKRYLLPGEEENHPLWQDLRELSDEHGLEDFIYISKTGNGVEACIEMEPTIANQLLVTTITRMNQAVKDV